MNSPTARQVEVWEAVQRNGGSTRAASRELNTSQATVRSAYLGYLANTGQASRRKRATLRQQLEGEAEARIEVLTEQVADQRGISRRLDRIEALLAQLLKRAPGPDHRRMSDGGRRVKEQRHEMRRIA